MINNVKLTELNSINDIKTSVRCLCLLQDKRIASACEDKTVKIYNIQKNECEIELKGFCFVVSYVTQLENGKVVACSYDRTIKVFTIAEKTYVCDITIDKHKGWVLQVIPLYNNNFASCSRDKKIKIWNGNPPYNKITTLYEHYSDSIGFINRMTLLRSKNYLVSSNEVGTLFFWNMTSYSAEHIISSENFDSENYNLFECENSILLVSRKDMICLFDLKSFQYVTQIKNEVLTGINSVTLFNNATVLISTNESAYTFNPITCAFQKVQLTHQEKPFNLIIQINQSQICTFSKDNKIKIFHIDF